MKKIKAITFDLGGTLAYGDFDEKGFSNDLINNLFSQGFSGGKSELNIARNGMLKKLKSSAIEQEIAF